MNYLSNTQNEITAIEINKNLFSRWIDFIDVKPKTVETYTRNIKPFMNYLKDNEISNPERQDIIDYRTMLQQEHKEATTVQAYLMAVKQFFKWAEIEGLYPDIAKNVKSPKLRREHKKQPLTIKQVQTLLNSIDRDNEIGKRDYAVLSLMLTTGLRTIEITRALVKDLETFTSTETEEDYRALIIRGKGRDDRTEFVKLSTPVSEAIDDYLTSRPDLTDNSPLFASAANRNSGQALTTRSISRIVKNRLKDIGIDRDNITAHSLRHTAGSLNLRNGGTLEETQQLLRHENINTTMIYIKQIERENNQSENRLSGLFFEE